MHYVAKYITIKTKAIGNGFRVSFPAIEKTSRIRIVW